MKTTCIALTMALLMTVSYAEAKRRSALAQTGSVVFIHPDGSGAASWAALRLLQCGPDGDLAWDSLPHLGVYRGHLADALVSSSNGGATAHAYGIKALYNDYGFHPDHPMNALSGAPMSIMSEARKAGMSIGVVNSGHIAEPGTGVFLASAASRKDTDTITAQIIASGAEVIFSGGETLLLPKGATGRFGVEGVRADGRNLIEQARESGYVVVYTREELQALPDTTSRVLGVFAPNHTFHDQTEESLRDKGLPLYVESAPTVAEMTDKALRLLSSRGKRFLLVVEEEGSDNFANNNNAKGTLEALRRADAAISVTRRFIQKHPATLMLTAADSDAGGMKIVKTERADSVLPATTDNGAALDGIDGTGTTPFMAAPDRAGARHAFAIAWAALSDLGGGIVARSQGLNADKMPTSVQNVDIYRLMYLTLFGRWPETADLNNLKR